MSDAAVRDARRPGVAMTSISPSTAPRGMPTQEVRDEDRTRVERKNAIEYLGLDLNQGAI